jgi:hypothetical protein
MTSSRYSKPAPAMRLHTFRFDLRHGMYRKITVHERALEDSSILLAMASLPEDHYFSEELFNSLQPIYEYLKTAEWHFQSPTTSGRLTELTKAYCMAIELDFQRLPNVLLRLGEGLKVEKEPDALFETAQVVYSKLTKAGDPYRAFSKVLRRSVSGNRVPVWRILQNSRRGDAISRSTLAQLTEML